MYVLVNFSNLGTFPAPCAFMCIMVRYIFIHLGIFCSTWHNYISINLRLNQYFDCMLHFHVFLHIYWNLVHSWHFYMHFVYIGTFWYISHNLEHFGTSWHISCTLVHLSYLTKLYLFFMYFYHTTMAFQQDMPRMHMNSITHHLITVPSK